jgi:dihydropteroate synthase
LILGIVNVTPDSFSDGGETPSSKLAIERALLLKEQGADILDIGGESTRPGAEPVSIDEEISRVIPVIEVLAGKGICVSVDTRNSPVMEAAIQAGATIVNDVTALQGDPQSLGVIAASSASVILMHMQGQPGSMQNSPVYNDVVAEVGAYLVSRIQACENAGVGKDRIAIDPGIGFGKTRDHNLALLKNLHVFAAFGSPLVLGVSRKSFIGRISNENDPAKRLAGSLSAGLAGLARGVSILRVHDVWETRQALDVWQAIEN